MHARTEEFLNLLLWSADMLLHPTFRNLSGSYEDWVYRQGLPRQLRALEQRSLLERDGSRSSERLCRLTSQGRLHALGGRDPEERWARSWDGLWRLVIFDVPVRQNDLRERLWRHLRARGFGYLQKSVWITPDPAQEERQLLAAGNVNVEMLVLLEGRPCAGETDMEIVAGAWDFESINR